MTDAPGSIHPPSDEADEANEADGDAIEVEIVRAIDGAWTALPAIRLGHPRGEPEAYVLVTRNGRPAMRLDLSTPSGEHGAFREAARWRGWIVVGQGEGVWFVPVDGGEPLHHRLTMYFSSFHAGPDYLLAASGENVTRFGPSGEVVWRSPPLAVDGVNLFEVDADRDRIEGDAEHDPPGGWRPFAIRLSDGQAIE